MITGFDKMGYWYNPGFFSIFGLIIYGFGMSAVTLPVMPEILDGIETESRFIGKYNSINMSNNVAGYFTMCQSLGETAGPLISSFLNIKIGIRPTQQILGIIVSIFLISYIVKSNVYDFFRI